MLPPKFWLRLTLFWVTAEKVAANWLTPPGPSEFLRTLADILRARPTFFDSPTPFPRTFSDMAERSRAFCYVLRRPPRSFAGSTSEFLRSVAHTPGPSRSCPDVSGHSRTFSDIPDTRIRALKAARTTPEVVGFGNTRLRHSFPPEGLRISVFLRVPGPPKITKGPHVTGLREGRLNTDGKPDHAPIPPEARRGASKATRSKGGPRSKQPKMAEGAADVGKTREPLPLKTERGATKKSEAAKQEANGPKAKEAQADKATRAKVTGRCQTEKAASATASPPTQRTTRNALKEDAALDSDTAEYRDFGKRVPSCRPPAPRSLISSWVVARFPANQLGNLVDPPQHANTPHRPVAESETKLLFGTRRPKPPATSRTPKTKRRALGPNEPENSQKMSNVKFLGAKSPPNPEEKSPAAKILGSDKKARPGPERARKYVQEVKREFRRRKFLFFLGPRGVRNK